MSRRWICLRLQRLVILRAGAGHPLGEELFVRVGFHRLARAAHQEYQASVREQQAERAAAKAAKGAGAAERRNPNDPARLLSVEHVTAEGELASRTVVALDESKVAEEARYDGFSCIATSLEDGPAEIIAVNKRRWQIEECFRIMKIPIVTCSSDAQLLNARSPMRQSVEGMLTSESVVHDSRQPASRPRTPAGMTTDSSMVLAANARSPTVVMPSGMRTCASEPLYLPNMMR